MAGKKGDESTHFRDKVHSGAGYVVSDTTDVPAIFAGIPPGEIGKRRDNKSGTSGGRSLGSSDQSPPRTPYELDQGE